MEPHITKDYYYSLDRLLMQCGRMAKDLTKIDELSKTPFEQFQDLCRCALKKKVSALGESRSVLNKAV